MRLLGVSHTLFLTDFLPHCSLWPYFSQEAGEMTCFQIQMNAPVKSFIHWQDENFPISVPGILSLRFTRKTESFKIFLSLNTDGTRTLVPFSRILLVSSSFPSDLNSFKSFLDSLLLPLLLVYLLIFQLQFFLNHFFLFQYLFLYPNSFFLLLCFLFEK